MKWFKRIVLICVALIIIAVVVIYFSLNSIIRSVVQDQATASLGVNTTLQSAQLSLFGGSLSLNGLDVSSPSKFSAPNIFTLGGASVAVHYGQLTDNPIHIVEITIDNPSLVVEQSNLSLNLKALMDQMPGTPKTSSGQPTQPMKLIIDELNVNNAQVTFMPGIPGLTNSVQVPIQSLTLKNIGNGNGNQNGAAIKDVVLQVATALAAKASSASKLPPAVKAILSSDLGGISHNLGGDFSQQLQGIAGSAGTLLKSGNTKNALQQLLGNPGK